MDHKGVVTVATIVGIHGLRGGVKAQVFADSGAFFQPGATIGLHRPDGRQETLTIRERGGNRGHLLFFEKITDRDQAISLVGADLVVARKALPETAAGEYYWHDLIGLRVVDCQDHYIGDIVSIIPTGGHDVYVVRGPEGEKLIPAIGMVVAEVDLRRATMCVNLPEGL